MGDQLGGAQWAFVWDINAALNTIQRFTMGQSAMGDPLATWGNAVLECELSAFAPAHTLVRFTYS
jgi:uncharacterized protein YmfQ (DUF2313 family)